MILPVLAALLTAVGPLLRGSWDLWAQSVLAVCVTAGFAAWLAARVVIGYLPLPPRRLLLWTAALAALSGLSVWSSPIRGLVAGDWMVLLCALWLFPAMTAISKDERAWIDEAIRVSAWILMVLAFYQHYSLHEDRPASALLNQNIYAGAVLMFLAIAVEKKDWLLALGLVWTLCWTRSLGAWLGLAVALGVTQRRSSAFWFWCGAAIASVCAVLLYAKLETPEALHRWWWWQAAVRMALARPLFGFGPGAFAYVYPRYLDRTQTGLFTLYAHEYPLEVLSSYGFLFGVLWFGGLWRCVWGVKSHKAFGALAVLVQSLWDYPLSIPSNLWLLSYFAASSVPDASDGVNIPARHKAPALLLIGGLAWVAGAAALRVWDAQKMGARASEAAASGQIAEARRWIVLAKSRAPENPELYIESARVEMLAGNWLQVAAELERSVQLNPYRPASWTELELAYRKLGRPAQAAALEAESKSFIAGPAPS